MVNGKGDMTPAQARRALSELLGNYDGRKIWGALTGQGDMTLAGPEDRNTLTAIGNTLDQSEIRRKTVGDAEDADPRGVEETPQGTAEMQAEGLTISYPVEFSIAVVGQPGDREIEFLSDARLVDELADVREALARAYGDDTGGADPVEMFTEDVAQTVATRLGGDLDTTDATGTVGMLKLRSDGRYTFRRVDRDETPQGALTPETTGANTGEQREMGRRPGDTEPTSQRPQRNQQTLTEAGTVESLSGFAEGTVDDDPDRTIGPADEVVEQRRSATTGGDRTAPRSSGLGQFEQFDAAVRVALNRDEGSTNAFGEELPPSETAMPFILPPDGRTIDMRLKSDLEQRLYDAINIPMMIDTHGANTTLTVGTATFSDGGESFEGFTFNDNWEGRSNV